MLVASLRFVIQVFWTMVGLYIAAGLHNLSVKLYRTIRPLT